MVATENKFMNDQFERFRCKKLLHIITWVKRFIHNCRQTHKRIRPLSTNEIDSSDRSLIIFVQSLHITAIHNTEKRRMPNMEMRWTHTKLQPYLQSKRSIISHIKYWPLPKALHSEYQVKCARSVKDFGCPSFEVWWRNIWKCGICKRYQVWPLTTTTQAMLPLHRTEFIEPFLVVGIDFAEPILYKRTAKETVKAHIALFTCSSTLAVHLKLTPDLSAPEFIKRICCQMKLTKVDNRWKRKNIRWSSDASLDMTHLSIL